MLRQADWPSVMTLLAVAVMLLVVPTSTTHVQLAGRDCPIPNWRVDDINVTYSDETNTPGSASFILSNSVTNKTESITCPLTFNSLCQVQGTPNDETLQILLQVNIDVAFMTLNQSWTCHDQTNQSVTDTFVIGTGTLDLNCPYNPNYDGNTTCNGPVDGTGAIIGTVVAVDEGSQ